MARFEQIPTFSFVVEGTGRFPFDMLRYDQCWPMTSKDAALMDYEPGERGIRRITMETFGERMNSAQPTVKRWESFTWRVVSGENR